MDLLFLTLLIGFCGWFIATVAGLINDKEFHKWEWHYLTSAVGGIVMVLICGTVTVRTETTTLSPLTTNITPYAVVVSFTDEGTVKSVVYDDMVSATIAKTNNFVIVKTKKLNSFGGSFVPYEYVLKEKHSYKTHEDV